MCVRVHTYVRACVRVCVFHKTTGLQGTHVSGLAGLEIGLALGGREAALSPSKDAGRTV